MAALQKKGVRFEGDMYEEEDDESGEFESYCSGDDGKQEVAEAGAEAAAGEAPPPPSAASARDGRQRREVEAEAEQGARNVNKRWQ